MQADVAHARISNSLASWLQPAYSHSVYSEGAAQVTPLKPKHPQLLEIHHLVQVSFFSPSFAAVLVLHPY
jgi:hypothetical protein